MNIYISELDSNSTYRKYLKSGDFEGEIGLSFVVNENGVFDKVTADKENTGRSEFDLEVAAKVKSWKGLKVTMSSPVIVFLPIKFGLKEEK